MTKKEFLEDTIAYYSEDVNRRCIKGTKCLYSPLNADKKGISKGCAIGRHLDEELQLTLDDADYTAVDGDEVFDSLPTWMQDLGQDFLYDVQRLHDLKNYWSDKGLSSDGLKFVEITKQKYDI